MIEALIALNNSKIFWGVSMILLNMGSRYIIGDLGKTHEKILTSEIFKKIILFSMFFVATRDVITSFLLTVFYVIVIDGLLHERRNFCVVKPQHDTESTPKPSLQDYENAKKTVANYESDDTSVVSQAIDKYDNYINNLYLLRYR
jgi:hypothetical protein